MFLFRRKRSFTIIEFLTSVCLIFILIGTFAIYADITLRVARETALRNELGCLRTALQYYQMSYDHHPQDLRELFNEGLTKITNDNTITPNKFINPFRIDKEGYLLDPFMQRYGYDSINGLVYSQTKGYERW